MCVHITMYIHTSKQHDQISEAAIISYNELCIQQSIIYWRIFENKQYPFFMTGKSFTIKLTLTITLSRFEIRFDYEDMKRNKVPLVAAEIELETFGNY